MEFPELSVKQINVHKRFIPQFKESTHVIEFTFKKKVV